MPKEIKIYSKLIPDKSSDLNKTPNLVGSLNDIITILMSVKNFLLTFGTILGSLIFLSYFAFYVGPLPSIAVSDLPLILLMIAAWGIFIILFFILISFGSAWWLKDLWSKEEIIRDNQQLWSQRYFFIYPIFSGFFLLLIEYNKFEKTVESWIFTFIFLLVPLLYSFILSWREITWGDFHSIYKIPLHATLTKGFFFPLAFFSFINILSAWALTVSTLNSFYIIVLIAIIIFINLLILSDKLNNIKSTLIFMLIYLIMISSLFSVLKVNNPIIVLPFQHYKLGDYNATFQFTADFNKSILYKLTGQEFKVLSSVGDEYIIQTSDNNAIYKVSKKYVLQPIFIDANSTKEVKK